MGAFVEAMGVDPIWVGNLQYCGSIGLGNYYIARIDVRGEAIASVARKYKMSANFDREIQWMGPFDSSPVPGPGRNG